MPETARPSTTVRERSTDNHEWTAVGVGTSCRGVTHKSRIDIGERLYVESGGHDRKAVLTRLRRIQDDFAIPMQDAKCACASSLVKLGIGSTASPAKQWRLFLGPSGNQLAFLPALGMMYDVGVCYAHGAGDRCWS